MSPYCHIVEPHERAMADPVAEAPREGASAWRYWIIFALIGGTWGLIAMGVVWLT